MAFIFVWYIFPPSVLYAVKRSKNRQKRHISRPRPGAPYIRARVHTYGRVFIVIQITIVFAYSSAVWHILKNFSNLLRFFNKYRPTAHLLNFFNIVHKNSLFQPFMHIFA